MPARRDHTDPDQLTPRQRAFADAFNSNGGNATAAYREAGYDCRSMSPSSVTAAASDLTRHPGVSILIAGTREAGRPKLPRSNNPADVNKEWLLREAMNAYNHAMSVGQAGAAKNTLELIGKLTGILVERKEIRVIRSLSDLSDEELEAIIGAPEPTTIDVEAAVAEEETSC